MQRSKWECRFLVLSVHRVAVIDNPVLEAIYLFFVVVELNTVDVDATDYNAVLVNGKIAAV